jgi:hypothetical protein
MKILLILLLAVTLLTCAKEYSREGIETPTTDTTFSDADHELISRYDFDVEDNSRVKKIYFCVKTKYHVGHYYITDSIQIQTTDTHYEGSFNLKDYLDMTKYVYKDTFPVFYQIRYKNSGNNLETDSITLIY